MLVIATDCVGGHYYTALDAPHNHPFFWCVIPPETLLKLITEYDVIDFENVTITKSSKWNLWSSAKNTFDIVLDGKYHIHYIHNKLSPDDYTIRKNGGDSLYRYAYKLTCDNYIRRLSRMHETNEIPKFIITEHNGYGYDIKMMALLTEKTKYPLAILTNKNIKTTNSLVHIIKISDYHISHYDNGRTQYILNEAKPHLDLWLKLKPNI